MRPTHACDVAIVGAGLAGGLIALALNARHSAMDVRLIDADTRVGGNHLWSFFGSDVAAADRWIVDPLICHSWPGYHVAFPGHARTITAPYHSIASAQLDAVVRAALPARALMLGRRVLAASATAVVLADGDRIAAKGVIDARGTGDLSMLDCAWQKFVGRELTLPVPHGVAEPTVMDASVAQIDGYRFVYCLPLSATRMFVEDTYYSDTPTLDQATIGARLSAYADGKGWQGGGEGREETGPEETGREETGREETGVLPIALGGDFEGYWRSGGTKVAKAGMRAGLFHPTTGYSLPDAVRSAAMLGALRDFDGAALHAATYMSARRTWAARGFYRMLDTMLFRAAEPEERYRVLERFYRLPPALIGRFYAGQSTMMDKARILTGKPPVPIARAVRALAGFGAIKAAGAGEAK